MSPIAIVSLGAVLPGASTVEAFGALVARGIDAATEVPPGRWTLSPQDAVSSVGPAPDRVRSLRAGLLDDGAWQVPLPGFDLLQHERAALDPSVQVLLAAASQAFSGLTHTKRERTAVVLGNIVLPTDGANALSQWVVGRQIEARLGLPLTPEPPPSMWNRWVAGLPAGVLARTLGLGADAFTLDAACASSLFAIHLAAGKLRRGEADLVLTGGLSRPSALYTQMGFSQLGALSPTGRCSPFDAAGDGLVVGEGAAVIALERLDDALAHGHTVHALVRGTGLSNDVDGRLLAPSSEGQLRAMRAAYAQAGWVPGDVELVECHATGTPVGDAIEFESLRQLRAEGTGHAAPAHLGASKANVGHLLTGAGAVAVLRALHAMKRGVIPPIANLRAPDERLQTEGTGLVLPREATAWPQTGRPRRAAVSGFGFGGTNAHVLLESPGDAAPQRVSVAVPAPRREPLAIVGLGGHIGKWRTLDALRERLFDDANDDAPAPKARFGDLESVPGWFIEALDVPLGRFRIPPSELAQLLPQQVLLLGVADEAMADLQSEQPRPEGARCGVFAGVELDFGTTDYHLRWVVRARAPQWARALGRPGEGPAFEAWVEGLCDALGPALSADRTMGGLASVGASRVARELRFGGPSYTLSSEESSGLTALQVAGRALQDGEIDLALVGAVGLEGDVRGCVGSEAATSAGTPAEGATALVLMRRSDALDRGERIYATLEGFGSASSSGALRPEPTRAAVHRSLERAREDACLDAVGVLDHSGSARWRGAEVEQPAALHLSTARRWGHVGAAAALASVVASALRLHHHVLDSPSPRAMHAVGGGAQRWVHDRAEGPRTIAVAALSSMGHVAHAILREHAAHVRPWTPPVHEALFVVAGDDRQALAGGLDRLAAVAEDLQGRPIAALARGWHHEHDTREGALALSMVCRDVREVARLARSIAPELRSGGPLTPRGEGRVMFTEAPLGPQGDLAFVFPGSGSQFVGMGRRLLLDFPEVAARQETAYGHLRSQLQADLCWSSDPQTQGRDARGLILAQVTLGTLASDAVRRFGVQPDAVIGYSLGETAGLFSLGAWSDREGMLERVAHSPLFATELTGPAQAVARRWGLAEGERVDWALGVVQADAAAVDAALAGEDRAYRLIVNTPRACVVGGDRAAVMRSVEALGADFHPLQGVTTVHCDVVRDVEDAYRALHVLPTQAPEGVRFYSGAWGKSYRVTQDTAADSVTAQAVDGLDYPAVIRQAWRDGVRLFVELGPGASCTRMIDAILTGWGERPFFARSVSSPTSNGRGAIARLLGWLATHRVPMDLSPLHAPDTFERSTPLPSDEESVRIEVGRAPLGPLPAAQESAPPAPELPVPTPMPTPTRHHAPTGSPAWLAPLSATADAHAAFLASQRAFMDAATAMLHQRGRGPVAAPQTSTWTDTAPPRALDRAACLAFAVGRIGDVLGPSYAAADAHPTRVRLPAEPLMLVDRILEIEGEPHSMSHGRVVTEHDVREGLWYLDAGRIPTCVAVEAGQADLFLSAFLGIDAQTKGLAVYRLLDATVTFHDRLPTVGAVIHYDIRIERFFRQGDTWLFRFAFDATVDGQPLMTMRDGCAGFFTEAELAAGKGVVDGGLQAQRSRSALADRPTFAPATRHTLDSEALEALRGGDLVAAFGEAFADLGVAQPRTLPGAPMDLVHRITALDPGGGTFGLGVVEGEADIPPDAWFITCHFSDDPVMPGTLMYECCLHTLRVFLLSLGWVGGPEASFEPRLGVRSRLKCRGQVLEHTKVVTYRITMREFGADPEPWVICDATMFADGKRIVDIEDMSCQLRGVTADELRARWGASSDAPSPRVYDKASLEAYAYGKPSEAFGAPYALFDGTDGSGRKIARLPGAPFQFMDRVPQVRGAPFVCEAGADCVAEVDRDTWAWTLEANRQDDIAFAVLLEIGLQACGWLAAYAGSALTADVDLKFRNLGGAATLHRAVRDDEQVLVMRAAMTRVSKSGGMIIQHFDFGVYGEDGDPIHVGTTYFGFFTEGALAEQKGLRDVTPHVLSPAQRSRSRPPMRVPDTAPMPSEKWRMIDRVEQWVDDAGAHGQGFLEGAIDVDPEFWFFAAHFHEDPVWPGSLGLEAFLQLLKVYAIDRFDLGPNARFCTMPLGLEHRWEYRGQVVPTATTVRVQVHIRSVDPAAKRVEAEGILVVDGRPIYSMHAFGVQAQEAPR